MLPLEAVRSCYLASAKFGSLLVLPNNDNERILVCIGPGPSFGERKRLFAVWLDGEKPFEARGLHEFEAMGIEIAGGQIEVDPLSATYVDGGAVGSISVRGTEVRLVCAGPRSSVPLDVNATGVDIPNNEMADVYYRAWRLVLQLPNRDPIVLFETAAGKSLQ